MRKNLKEKHGITLMALVVTVILLLILAGISIATLTGDNGIIQKAIVAKNETRKAQIVELVQLQVLETYVEKGKFDSETFKDKVENNLLSNLVEIKQ